VNCVPGYDQNRIADLEERLAVAPVTGRSAVSELEMLADLYLQSDSYVPALATIDRLLALPEARALSLARRAALESKAVSCRLAQGAALEAYAQTRDLLQRSSDIDNPSIVGKLHVQCASALLQLGRFDECEASARRGLEIAEQSSDLPLAAEALIRLGRVAYRTGDLSRARDCFEEALALYRRVGGSIHVAHVHNNLGLVHKNLCQWETAESHLTAALDDFRRQSQFAETANPLINLGVVHQKRGEWGRAGTRYAEARSVSSQVGDQQRLVIATIGLGNVARLERRFEDAEAQLGTALDLARSLHAKREEVLSLEFLGELEFDRGRFEAALRRYLEAMTIAERVAPEGDLVVEIERRRAEALCALDRLDEADAACRRACRLAEQIDDRLEAGVARRVAGSIAARRGRHEEAARWFNEALARLGECRERFELGRTLLEMSRFSEGSLEARRHLYRAIGLFAELSTPHWLELAERELERVMANGVPPVTERPASILGRRLRAPSLVAGSHEMRRVESLARRAAGTELTVLITGETGTGKELVARTIHALSGRAQQPFLAVNCGALRADLALSQLFGHRKGAFTGAHTEGVGLVEAANGGTLFLDEVGELPLDVQVTLLRFLESGEYMRLGEAQVRRSDARLIAATNRELRGADEKLFRRDLLFRLAEIEIRVPTLRERGEDIIALARHFLAFYGGLSGPRLTPDAESVLRSYAWPGNVRELENVMKRIAALHASDGEVDANGLLPFLTQGGSAISSAPPNGHVDDERAAILSAFAEAQGNKSRIAEMLGVSRKTLYARIKRLNLELPLRSR
jgi:DNA-binding NtrC family response regulator/tetratricopeptide (TPR) repeat protein